jgi:FixJ family two-component response regulator
VIDDDESLREGLKRLFQSMGQRAEVFASAPEFLKSKLPHVPSCLVLDIRLPGLSGLDFQAKLGNENIHIPIIFITGYGDIPMSVRAMKGWGGRVPNQAASRTGSPRCRWRRD